MYENYLFLFLNTMKYIKRLEINKLEFLIFYDCFFESIYYFFMNKFKIYPNV